MKKLLFITLSALLCSSLLAQTRMIVMSDIGGSDPDDTQSMVHLLVSLDRVELEGFISQHAWVPYGNGAVTLINQVIDAYEEVYPNLQVHSNKFPTASYLRSVVKVGQAEAAMHGVGDGKDSEGSEWIIKTIDKDDDRPVWITAWSGLNTLAQALWKVSHTRTAEQVERFVSKVRVYDVLGQDDAGAWIVKNYPNLVYIRNTKIYGWPPSDEWVRKNVQEVGPLGKCYPNRIWATEGDSPSFMYCLSNGLNEPEHSEYGGWGGRFSTEKVAGIRGMDWVKRNGLDEPQYDPYYMIPAAKEGSAAITRWKDAIYNDFIAKMQWTVKADYKAANHHPVAVVAKDRSLNSVHVTCKAGKTIVLNASKSSDPDGDTLTFDWSIYREASGYQGDVTIIGKDQKRCRVMVPADARGKDCHVILQVTDAGIPALTSYRRVILHIN